MRTYGAFAGRMLSSTCGGSVFGGGRPLCVYSSAWHAVCQAHGSYSYMRVEPVKLPVACRTEPDFVEYTEWTAKGLIGWWS